MPQVQGAPPPSRARQALLAEAPQDVSAYLSEPDSPVAVQAPKTSVSPALACVLLVPPPSRLPAPHE